MRKFNIEQITCNAHFIEQDLTYNTHFSLHIVYNSNLHNQCIRRESSFFLVTITSFQPLYIQTVTAQSFPDHPELFREAYSLM